MDLLSSKLERIGWMATQHVLSTAPLDSVVSKFLGSPESQPV